jgi:cytochrome c oxidase assembly protein subunit 15
MNSPAGTASAELARHRTAAPGLSAVRIWLFAVAAFVFAMVILGGATRLTGSGLSITEWRPIIGIIPPLSEAAWQDTFEKYRQIPEYQLVNKGMSLEGFKAIFWWEWAHRLLGQLIGFVFLLPFVYFLVYRAIPKPYIPRIAALFILGGAQGALGWFMVKSGLSDRVDVSQYRLAAHLALAVAIASYAFWLGLSIRDEISKAQDAKAGARFQGAKRGALLLAGLVYIQIIAGAFVAGLKAGHASNTWPLMNGEIIPPGLDVYTPWYLNLFENPLAAQFAHRMLAYLIVIFAAAFAFSIWRLNRLRGPAAALGLALLVQTALGIGTILYGVPLGFALAHQANATVVLALSLWTLYRAVDVSAVSLGGRIKPGHNDREPIKT